jgi:hypothetical protein
MSDQTVVHSLISEEIRRIVAEAIESGSCLIAGQHVAAITRAYQNARLTPAQLENLLLEAAIRAGVPVEFGQRGEAGRAAA